MNKNKKISFTDNELSLISDIFHEYKDNHRGIKSDLLPVMEIEKKLSGLSGQRYTPDTTYDWKDSGKRKTARYNYVDLGLPSGKLWATENVKDKNGDEAFFTFDESVNTFGDNLPSWEDWKELFNNSSCRWNQERKGYDVTGPNGNSIFLPVAGYRDLFGVHGVGSHGYYWSSSVIDKNYAYYVAFRSGYLIPLSCYTRRYGFSVRLVR